MPFIVKLYKFVTCWMCICVCMVRIEWKVNKIWYYHFKIWCLHIIWGHFGLDTEVSPRHKFYCIFIQFLHVFSMEVLCRFFSYCSLYTSTHFLIDWQPGVGILLIHINLCLLVLYLVSKLSCYLTCWVNTSSSWDNHTCKSMASSRREAGA